MADFDDVSLRPSDGHAPRFEPPPSSGPALWPFIVVGVVILSVAAWWYVRSRSGTPPPAAPAAKQAADVPRRPGEPGDKIDLPPLDQSDTLVRTLVSHLSSHPMVAAWLTTDGLVRNFTVAVENVSKGGTPAKHLKPLRPKGPFTTKTAGGATVIDPASYRRYDGIAAAVDSVDARGAARLYATLKPRVEDAYHDLIGPDANFDVALERAIVLLLKTPVVDRNVELRTEKVSYRYADESLEGLTSAQRQFLRMGPQNMRIVKAKLRAIAGFLGIPDALLPPPD